ncbi:MAG: TonB-dependent receptor, partial [Saprospiraceae bacterium]|nr:TonB-dependent receptor [Saprospiraceae bacterium]
MKHIFLSLFLLNIIVIPGIAQSDIIQGKNNFEILENQTLKEVLDNVSEQFEVLLAYPTPLLKNLSLAPANYSFSDVEELLDQMFSDFKLDVKQVSSEKYLIRKSYQEPSNMGFQEYSGVVRDKESGQALAFASVYFSDFSNGTFTDSEGRFTLAHKGASSDTIIISYLAYGERKLYTQKPDQYFEVFLDRNENIITDVLVEYIVPPTMFTRDGMALVLSDKMPTGQNIVSNDLMRKLQLLPGINAYNDDESSLKIRGSNADQSRIILDGMPLYNVDHYYGIFSSVNDDFVDQVSLYKNAQPVQHQAFGGGLVLMDSESDPINTKAILRVDLLNTTAAISSPLTRKLSLNLGLRTTYRNVDDGGLINLKRRSNDPENFNNPQNDVFISNEPDFRFYDLNGRLNFKLSNKTSLSYSIFKSHDRYINSYDLNFQNHQQQNSRTIFENREAWDNFSSALLLVSRIIKNWLLNG